MMDGWWILRMSSRIILCIKTKLIKSIGLFVLQPILLYKHLNIRDVNCDDKKKTLFKPNFFFWSQCRVHESVHELGCMRYCAVWKITITNLYLHGEKQTCSKCSLEKILVAENKRIVIIIQVTNYRPEWFIRYFKTVVLKINMLLDT